VSWIAISESAVRSTLAAAELSALRTVQLAAGQMDPLAEIIERTVDEVRGYVAANPLNRVGAAGTIPGELEAAALALVRYRLVTRLPLKTLLTEARKDEQRDAITLLRDVAGGRFAILPPDDGGEPAAGIGYYGSEEDPI
jgi:phage gp36-like protein